MEKTEVLERKIALAQVWAGLLFKGLATVAALPLLLFIVPFAFVAGMVYLIIEVIKHYVPQSRKRQEQDIKRKQSMKSDDWTKDLWKGFNSFKSKENA